MAISRARLNFRIFLGILLVLSFGFFSISAYYYMSVKKRSISITSITPTLFQLDIYQHYARAYFQNKDEQHIIANSLYNKGFFAQSYRMAGADMMEDLADSGHAPSQVVHADIVLRDNNIDDREAIAKSYYEAAANQDYPLAVSRLKNF